MSPLTMVGRLDGLVFFFSSRRRHTRSLCDWSSDVCSSDLVAWDTLLEGNVRTLIERDLLVGFLQRQRWFGGKARPMRSARFVDWGLLRRAPQPLFLTIVEVEYADG